jgi:hypothetical protein
MRWRCGLLILVVVAGCAPVAPKPPKIVEVPVTVYVPVPPELTEPVAIALPKSRTVDEAVRVARERRASLEQCNGQLEQIRTLKPPSQEK